MRNTNVSATARPSRALMLPPPLYFGLAFGAGMLLHQVVPLTIPDFPLRAAFGLLLVAMGVISGPSLAAIFLVRRTTLNPFAPPNLLFDKELYRLSRNPMYLGVILIYLGGCMLAGSIWPILFMVFPVALLTLVVIPYEETSMRRVFGPAYDDYCAKVRRWF